MGHFVYNICLISINNLISDQATNKWVLFINGIAWVTLTKKMSFMYWILFVQHEFNNANILQRMYEAITAFAAHTCLTCLSKL